jgi:ATP-dependent protease ClpP protease subunit
MNEILLYGNIGPYSDVDPQSVIRQLQAFKGQPVNLRVLSSGGDVFSGLAIYNYLRGMPNISATVDGLAASIASVIMLGAGRVTMPRNGFVAVHQRPGSSRRVGRYAGLGRTARSHGLAASGHLRRETSQDEKTTREWMQSETWFDAEQALAAGLIDEITEPVVLQAKIDLGRFIRTPAALTNQLKPASPAQPKNHMTKLLTLLRELKLLDATDDESNEDAITAKVRTALAAIIAQNETLAERLKTGLEARAKTAVEAAIADGRVAKTVQNEFVAAYIRDEVGTVAILGSLPKPTGTGTAPVGFGGASDRVPSLVEKIAAESDPRKRVRMMTNNWGALHASRT